MVSLLASEMAHYQKNSNSDFTLESVKKEICQLEVVHKQQRPAQKQTMHAAPATSMQSVKAAGENMWQSA